MDVGREAKARGVIDVWFDDKCACWLRISEVEPDGRRFLEIRRPFRHEPDFHEVTFGEDWRVALIDRIAYLRSRDVFTA